MIYFEKLRNHLRGLFFIVAEDACYHNIPALEEHLKMVYHTWCA
jgi:hypothetical protein